MEYKHYYEDGEWHRERIDNIEEGQSERSYINQLEQLRDLHQELDDEMAGWSKVLEQSEQRLESAKEQSAVNFENND